MNIPLPIVVIAISIAFSVMTGLIGILLKVLNNNTKAIEDMKIFIAKQETADGYEDKSCNEKHCNINALLSEHSAKIEAHGIIVAEHEIKIKQLQLI
jgi:hypothetical protein